MEMMLLLKNKRSLFYEMIGNCKFKYIHCCNSAAMTYHHDEKSNMGRLGITMYGCSPNGEEETKIQTSNVTLYKNSND